jgi:hypothetical protein
LLFNFALEYAIKKVQTNEVELKMNGTYQALAYADDVNLLEDNVDTVKKNTETLIDANREAGVCICCCLVTGVWVKIGDRLEMYHSSVFGNDSSKSKFDSGGN